MAVKIAIMRGPQHSAAEETAWDQIVDIANPGAYGRRLLADGSFSRLRRGHHTAYLHSWLNQAGVTSIDEVRFEPTLLTADPAGDFERATHRAAALAAVHGRSANIVQ